MNRTNFLNLPTTEIMWRWNEPVLPPIKYDLEYEAQCSSWIESEDDYVSNLQALVMNTEQVNIQSLNDAHGVLLRGQDNKLPGRFRQWDVVVGHYRPPTWSVVPNGMFSLQTLLLDKSIPTVFKAVWGHIMFESIHPYADGNGRIGRWLVNKLLNRPWSPIVLKERDTYYHLLDKGSWGEWSEWMIDTLTRCPNEERLFFSPWA